MGSTGCDACAVITLLEEVRFVLFDAHGYVEFEEALAVQG